MRASFSVYRLADGMIVKSGYCSPDDLIDQHWPDWPPEDQAIYPEELDDVEWYLPEGVPTKRPVLTVADATIPADGSDHVIAAELPGGTEVHVAGHLPATVDDGTLALSAHEPGTFTLRIAPPFPWRQATITVRAE